MRAAEALEAADVNGHESISDGDYNSHYFEV